MDVVQDTMMTKNSHGMRQTNIVYQKEKDSVIHKTNLTSAVAQAATIIINSFGLVRSKVGLSLKLIIDTSESIPLPLLE